MTQIASASQWRRRLFTKVDLYLLRDSLERLSETPYFSKDLHNYTNGLIGVIAHVLTNTSTYPPPLIAEFTKQIWVAHKYLRGSISREIPYEIVYALRAAVKEWVKTDCVVTMSLADEKDFHFVPLDSWGHIRKLIPGFHYPKFDALLIQVALPRIYKNKPLFTIPLYHELGHFVDRQLGVVNFSFLLSPHSTPNRHREERHRREYFADLFAAQYVGSANWKVLNEIANGHNASDTHPATVDRLSLSQDFLAGRPSALIDLFGVCLKNLSAPPLSIKFRLPTLTTAFDNIRPYVIPDTAELHGIFEAGWTYLESALKRLAPPWDAMKEETVEQVVNDLVEKSIRNMSIREKWRHGAVT